jgi:hypothetical protein
LFGGRNWKIVNKGSLCLTTSPEKRVGKTVLRKKYFNNSLLGVKIIKENMNYFYPFILCGILMINCDSLS